MGLGRLVYLILFLSLVLIVSQAEAQVIDTIANWDGTNVEWTIISASGEVVENPEQLGINPSENCMEITTSNSSYDLIYTDLSQPVNFDEFPFYRLKILAPASGGSVLLKFENSTNTSWEEIEKTPIPGEWNDLEFDFSYVTASDIVRMVIFFDFHRDCIMGLAHLGSGFS